MSIEEKIVSKPGFFRWLFGKIEVKLALKTGIAASISLFLGLGFSKILERPDTLVSGLWCVMASIVVLQAQLGGTYKAAWVRFLGVLVGTIVGGIFTSYIGVNYPLGLGISIFFTIVICSLLNIKESFRIASLSTAVVIILGGLNPTINPWIFSLFRFLDSCIGILVAVFVAHVLWPEKATENLRLNIVKTLKMISKYYRLAVDQEFEIGKFNHTSEELFVEIQELLLQNRAFLEESKLELLSRPPQPEDWVYIVSHIESNFESVAALKGVNKEVLIKIFDDGLARQVANMIDKTDLGFQDLEKLIEFQKPPLHLASLEEALTGLNNELARFRETRTTRKFNLEDVESFFVFFYRLRAIAEAVKKMEIHLQQLFGIASTF